ncbi:transcription initiation factor IIB [Metallosphaera hakonensis]
MQSKSRVTSKEKKSVTYLHELNSEAAKLNLPNYVKEDAAAIMKKLIVSGLARRIDKYALVVATLYYVARQHRLPIQYQEIKAKYGINSSLLWDAIERVQMVAKSTSPSYPGVIGAEGTTKGPSPLDYITMIQNKTELPALIVPKSAEIVDILYKHGLTSGKGYLSIAAASVYLVSALLDHKKTQKEMAEALNITEVTIRNRYKEIVDALDIEVYL